MKSEPARRDVKIGPSDSSPALLVSRKLNPRNNKPREINFRPSPKKIAAIYTLYLLFLRGKKSVFKVEDGR